MKHRGLLHHQIVVVSNLQRSSNFYGTMLRYLGYECSAKTERYEDWTRWDLDAPHEISIVPVKPELSDVRHVRGAVGHHHHTAFAAADRSDVDRFHAAVLVPLARDGACRVLDAPAECPEYGEGYYATFFEDPDGLRFEYVFNQGFFRKRDQNGQNEQR